MPIIQLILSLLSGAVGTRLTGSLLGGLGRSAAGKAAASGLGSIAGKIGGTVGGQALGRGATSLAGALPNAIGRHIPTTSSAVGQAAKGIGGDFALTLGGGAAGIAPFLLLGGHEPPPTDVVVDDSLAPQRSTDDALIGQLLSSLQGQADDGTLDNPDIETLLSRIRNEGQPLRLI